MLGEIRGGKIGYGFGIVQAGLGRGRGPSWTYAVRSSASKEKERRKFILLQQQDKDVQIKTRSPRRAGGSGRKWDSESKEIRPDVLGIRNPCRCLNRVLVF